MSDLAGRRLGRYELRGVIRHGGMSTVYKAYQPSLQRLVAVKVLAFPGDPEFVARFQREARSVAALQHPNIVQIYDYGEHDGQAYLVEQYVEDGRTLADLPGRPPALARTLVLMEQVLAALGHAHERGIVHRDVKPSNVLLAAPTWAMLADFGIAKLLLEAGPNLTSTNLVVGTAAYMAPEQAFGLPLDPRTDLYAAGVVLYELLTGPRSVAVGAAQTVWQPSVATGQATGHGPGSSRRGAGDRGAGWRPHRRGVPDQHPPTDNPRDHAPHASTPHRHMTPTYGYGHTTPAHGHTTTPKRSSPDHGPAHHGPAHHRSTHRSADDRPPDHRSADDRPPDHGPAHYGPADHGPTHHRPTNHRSAEFNELTPTPPTPGNPERFTRSTSARPLAPALARKTPIWQFSIPSGGAGVLALHPG